MDQPFGLKNIWFMPPVAARRHHDASFPLSLIKCHLFCRGVFSAAAVPSSEVSDELFPALQKACPSCESRGPGSPELWIVKLSDYSRLPYNWPRQSSGAPSTVLDSQILPRVSLLGRRLLLATRLRRSLRGLWAEKWQEFRESETIFSSFQVGGCDDRRCRDRCQEILSGGYFWWGINKVSVVLVCQRKRGAEAETGSRFR